MQLETNRLHEWKTDLNRYACSYIKQIKKQWRRKSTSHMTCLKPIANDQRKKKIKEKEKVRSKNET